MCLRFAGRKEDGSESSFLVAIWRLKRVRQAKDGVVSLDDFQTLWEGKFLHEKNAVETMKKFKFQGVQSPWREVCFEFAGKPCERFWAQCNAGNWCGWNFAWSYRFSGLVKIKTPGNYLCSSRKHFVDRSRNFYNYGLFI